MSDGKFYRKYLMSKLDSVQREAELLKGAIKALDASEGGDEEETEVVETKPAKGKAKPAPAAKPAKGKAKPAAEEEAEEESETEEEETEEESDDMFSDDEEGDDEPTLDDVRKIVKNFASKHGKPKGMKLLGKFGVTSIPDLKKTDYAKVIELAKKHM